MGSPAACVHRIFARFEPCHAGDADGTLALTFDPSGERGLVLTSGRLERGQCYRVLRLRNKDLNRADSVGFVAEGPQMKAIKYQVRIGRDHRVVVDLPAETPEGMAEVIVLVPEPLQSPSGLAALLADWRTRAGGRTAGEIDSELAAERASWSD